MDASPPPSPVTAQCIVEAAVRQSLPIEILVAVLAVEGGKPGLAKKNENGTYDLGPAQINSIHVGKDIPAAWVKNHGCYNTHVMAYRLRAEINRVEGNFWRGVGNYHSRTPHLHAAYMRKIARAVRETGDYSTRLRSLYAQQVSPAEPAGEAFSSETPGR